MKYFHLLLLAIIVFTFSCQQDEEFSQNTDNNNSSFNFKVANLMVRAVDIEGNPIPNATAYASMNQFATDANGLAYFQNIHANNSVFHVKTIAEGYAPAFANVKVNRKNCFVEMVLVPHQTQQFQSTQAQQITIGTQQAKLELQANAFVDMDGNAYNGTITAEVAYINPTMENFGQAMPGTDFMGIDEEGNDQFLVSYGTISAEFFGANGQELQLAPESPASIELPIPTNATTTPNEIPMWYFDEEQSIWLEEGKAILQGEKYIATVNHFTWWNCDDKVDSNTFISGYVHDCDGLPIEGYAVQVGLLTVYTNSNGYFESNIPPMVEFNISLGQLFDSVYVSGVNANENLNLGIIQPIQNLCPIIEVSFNVVDCNNNPIETNYNCFDCPSWQGGIIEQGETKVVFAESNTQIIITISNGVYWEFVEITVGNTNINYGAITFCDECENIDCGENGNCINGVCICNEGYYGEFCENYDEAFICSIPACENGTLIETEEDCYCDCDEGWTGTLCEIFTAGHLIFGEFETTDFNCPVFFFYNTHIEGYYEEGSENNIIFINFFPGGTYSNGQSFPPQHVPAYYDGFSTITFENTTVTHQSSQANSFIGEGTFNGDGTIDFTFEFIVPAPPPYYNDYVICDVTWTPI